MPKLTFPAPLTCKQTQAFFPQLLRQEELPQEELPVESRGRVEGHLLACEECAVAFVEAIDLALARGDIPQPVLPAVPMPRPDIHVSGHGVVKGWLWEVVHREGRRAVAMLQRLPASLGQTRQGQDRSLGQPVEALGQREAPATAEVSPLPGESLGAIRRAQERVVALLAHLESRMQATRPLWQMATASPGALGAFLGAAPLMGGEGIKARVEHLDVEWQPTDTVTEVDIEDGPAITTGGELRFTVVSHDARVAGQRLICIVYLVEDEAIRFETDTQPIPNAHRWSATFHATGLPTTTAVGEPFAQDVRIPLEMIELYAVPRSGEIKV